MVPLPSVGLWGIYCCLLSWPCSKEKRKKLCRFSKMNFQGQEIFIGFSIDRLSRMTLVLDNSLFSQKTTFKNDKMRSHECLYFVTQSIERFFFPFLFWTLLVVYGTPTKRVEWAIFDWTDLEINLGAQVTWANKQIAYIHIPMKVK